MKQNNVGRVRLQSLALLLLEGGLRSEGLPRRCEQRGSGNPAQVLLHLCVKARCGKEAYLMT